MNTNDTSSSIHLLIVEDEDSFRALLESRLNRRGYFTRTAANGTEALRLVNTNSFDIALVDIRLPDQNGLELLQVLRKLPVPPEVIMMTGHGTIETAIDAMRQGAYHYLTKPLDLKELELVLAKALERRKLSDKVAGLNQALSRQTSQVELIGASPAFMQIVELTKKAADWDLPVLLTGESGTGKELIAKALHQWGSRRRHPWIAVNCGALPGHLLESELFGHEKGAFTGAVASRIGLVEAADQGTLFLDEIGELEVSLQAKLLRFLESGEYRRIGNNRLYKTNVRIIAATNRNLEDASAAGQFREDLYYRLSGIVLRLPPLRSRPGDIRLLVKHFLQRRFPQHPPIVEESIWSNLESYHFPGNVRELSYMVDRACLLAEGNQLQWQNFAGLCNKQSDQQAASPPENSSHYYPPGLPLEDIRRRHVLATLELVHGNKSLAADKLGIGLRTLYRYLEEWNME